MSTSMHHEGLSHIQKLLLATIAILSACNTLRYVLSTRFTTTVQKLTYYPYEFSSQTSLPRDIPFQPPSILISFETDPLSKYYAPRDFTHWIGVDPEKSIIRLPVLKQTVERLNLTMAQGLTGPLNASRYDDEGLMANGADEEWRGNGRVQRNGEETKEVAFIVSMYHILHCLYFIRFDLEQSRRGVRPLKMYVDHAAHCYNYVRQAVMCGGDVTLEPRIVERLEESGSCVRGDGAGADERLGKGAENGEGEDVMEKLTGEGAPMHVCKDWKMVDKFVMDNFKRHGNATGILL